MGATSPSNVDGPGGTYLAPLRRVFPWWFIGGAVVSIILDLVAIRLTGGAIGAMVAGWLSFAMFAVVERRNAAAARDETGLAVARRDLSGPVWLEPVLAVCIAGLFAALGMLLTFSGRFPGHPTAGWRQVITAVLLLVAAGASYVLLTRWWSRQRQPSLVDEDAHEQPS